MCGLCVYKKCTFIYNERVTKGGYVRVKKFRRDSLLLKVEMDGVVSYYSDILPLGKGN